MTQAPITVSAPGRICLFGEHQDYLGLPVIAAAVNLRAFLHAEPAPGATLLILKPDTRESESINLRAPIAYEQPRDYFKSGVRVLQKHGARLDRGLRVTLTSNIPVSKGCSSSSAICVAWTGLLCRAAGYAPEGNFARGIARLAYEAEVLEFGEPGGMMDHFASALGGVQYIETTGGFRTEPLFPPGDGAFVLGDSLEPKATTAVLSRVKNRVLAGLDYLAFKQPGFNLDHADPDQAAAALGADVSEPVRRAVLGNLRNRDITRRALDMFRKGDPGGPDLGALLDAEHAILRDDLGISTPRIERLIAAARAAGAAGCKINGSGGGGCIFAWCPGDPAPVAAAIAAAGAKACLIHIDHGFREDPS